MHISVYSVLPLLRDSVGILMQRTPREIEDELPGCYQRVCFAHLYWYHILPPRTRDYISLSQRKQSLRGV